MKIGDSKSAVSNTLATSHMWLADLYFVASQRFLQPKFFLIESWDKIYELFK